MLGGLYTRLAADAVNAEIVVLTYPQILPSDGAGCTVNFVGAMTTADVKWIYQEWEKFDIVIKQAALDVPHVAVLDEEHAFDGHDARTSSGTPDANGLVVNARTNSFHPNWRRDQQLATDAESFLHLP